MHTTAKQNTQAYDNNNWKEKQCVEWLNKQSEQVRRPVRAAALAGLFSGLGVIGQSWLLAYILHRVIIDEALWQILQYPILVLLALIAFRAYCGYCFQAIGFKAGAEVKRQVRRALFNKISLLGPCFTRHLHSGEIAATMVEQVDGLENYFARYLPQQKVAVLLPILMIAAVMPVNWVVGLIFLVTGPLIPVFMVLIGMGAASASRNQFLVLSRMGGYFLDRLQGMETLKIFGQAENELEKIAVTADRFRERTMSVLRIAFMSSAVLEFFSAVAIALVAVYVGLGLLGLVRFGPAGDITLQEALFVLLLAPEFFMPLKQMAASYHDRATALASADAIRNMLETEISDRKSNQFRAQGPLIEAKKINKTFGNRPVLDDLSFTIQAGEKVALAGESGAGKTTLLNLLMGLEPLTSGHIFFNELLLDKTQQSHFAWSGQNAYLFHDSIRSNIALAAPDATDAKIEFAADAAGVTEFTARLKEGLNTKVGERGYGLSGGQIQRIALARAFLSDAPVVLLDEPTANLDLDHRMKLLDTIDRLFADKTMIIATHDKDVIERMDRIIDLEPCWEGQD